MAKRMDRILRRHLRDKPIVDQAAKGVGATQEEAPATQSPTTSTGLPVEEQVRKQWNPRKGGLPVFFRSARKTPGQG